MKKHCTIAVLLDVSAAFDAVWLEGLKIKIKNSTQLNCLSERVFLQAGTPQGSCLSPLLYAIFVNDLPLFQKTEASQ